LTKISKIRQFLNPKSENELEKYPILVFSLKSDIFQGKEAKNYPFSSKTAKTG